MAVRGETYLMQDLKASIAISTVLTVSGFALAAAQTRTVLFRPGPSARVTSALLWPTIFFFIGGYAVTLAVPAYVWTHGPWEKNNYFYWTDFDAPDALFRLIVLFPGLSNLLAVVACRTLFYELVAHKAFQAHRKARRVFLGFDITIGILAVAILLATTGAGRPCCLEGGTTPGELLMTSVFDWLASLGFQYFLFAGYVMTGISAAFARKWTRRYGVGVATADRILTVLCPLLSLEFILLLIMTIVHFDGDIKGTDFLDFYVSIPWRIGQVAIIGVLIWLTSFPLAEDTHTNEQISLPAHRASEAEADIEKSA